MSLNGNQNGKFIGNMIMNQWNLGYFMFKQSDSNNAQL